MSAVAERRSPTSAAAIVGWVGLIIAVDQASKAWVVAHLDDGHHVQIIGTWVEFALARNSGAAFSRFQGMTPVLALVAIGMSLVLVRMVRRSSDRLTIVGLVLVLGGALGNLVDRFARSPGFLRGHVVDFVKVGSFPLFNVADSCITCGAILLAVRAVVLDRRAAPDEVAS